MACKYYYFCGFDHKCSINGSYGSRISDSHYSRYCKNNFKKCQYFDKTNRVTNKNSNNPNNGNNNSGCFITTIVCNTTGIKNEYSNKVLNNFRWFRNNILQSDNKYDDILKSYDVVGPIIVNCIVNDKNKMDMVNGLYKNALIPINKLICDKKYDVACEMYYLMVLSLINYYDIKHYYNDIVDNNYGYDIGEFDPKVSGHGYVRKLVKNNEKNIS